MGRLLLAFWAFLVCARAEPPALKLSVPTGPAPHAKLAALQNGFTLNAEVLERYQYSLEAYNKLSESERGRVFDWIRILENERLLAEARAAVLTPPYQVPFKSGWSSDQHAAFGRIKDSAEARAHLFDGAGKGGSGKPYFTPEVELFGLNPTTLPDGTPGTGYIRRLTLVGPSGLKLEYGNLGLAPVQSPLVMPSPYFSVSKEGSKSGSLVDTEYKLRGNMVNLGARIYTNDAPGLDRRVDESIESLRTLDGSPWGVSGGDVDKMHDRFSFSHQFEREWMFVGSALGRVGRAYELTDRWAVGWSAMGVTRFAGIFPNLTLDQTVGSRVRIGDNTYFGGFVGVTEGLGLFARSMVKDSLDAGKMKTDIHPEAAPHQEFALWGKMPYLSSVEYTLVGGQQFNPWTTLRTVNGSVAAPIGDTKVGLFGSYSTEGNSGLEFSRNKATAGVSVTPTPGLDIWGQFTSDSARFGSANMDMKAAFFGVTITETGGAAKGSKVTMDMLLGGQQGLVTQEKRQEFVELLQTSLDALQALKDAGIAFGKGPDGAWQAMQDAWARLPASSRALANQAWGLAAPNAPSLYNIMSTKPADFKTINQLVDMLSDTKVLERLLVRAVRHEILKELKEVDLSILGKKVKMSAPMVIAAAHAYGLSLSPIPPITEKDARESLDGFLLKKIGKEAGCANGTGTASAMTDCILSKMDPAAADELRRTYGNNIDDLIKAAVKWPSDVLRHEMNRMALQIILAAETLNEISVDEGKKIAELNVRGLMKSFSYLDSRSRKFQHTVYQSIGKDLKAELDQQEAAMRAHLTEYGSGRLAWLQQQTAWPSNVTIVVRTEDWAELLAIYGDAALFDLILRCKGKMAAPADQAYAAKQQRLYITLDRYNPLNSVSFIKGDPSELKLPPKSVTLKDLSFAF